MIVEEKDDRAEQIAGFLQEGGLEPIRIKSGLDAVTWLTEAQYEDRMPCAMLLGQELPDIPILEMAAHVER